MKYKTKREAAEGLIDQFDQIPFALIERAFGDQPDDLELLAGGQAECRNCGYQPEDEEPPPACPECNEDADWEFRPVYAWPAAWGWLFHPRDPVDRRKIEQDPKGCAEAANVLVYNSNETGLLLAVDGAGYDFYEAHWIPLYEWLGYHWHERKQK